MKVYIILFLMAFICTKSSSQVKSSERETSPYHFRLKVKEKETMSPSLKRELSLDLFQMYSSANIIINSAAFTLEKKIDGLDTLISMPARDADLRIDYQIGSTEGKNFGLNISEYFIEEGDQLDIELYKDTLVFKGKDSLKFNIQTHLFSLNRGLSSKVLKQDKSYFEQFDKLLQSNMKAQLTFLNTKQRYISPQLYTFLYNQIIGIRCYRLLSSVVVTRKIDKTSGEDGVDYFLKIEKNLPVVNNNLVHRASYYTDFLFIKERLKFELENTHRLNNKTGAVELLDIIARKYTGYIKDRLLITGVVSLSKQYLDADSYFLKIENIIPKSSPYYGISQSIKNAFSTQSKAFAFALPDSSDRIVKLQDFKGKTLVVDYWFTGCRACINLQKSLAPVYKHFKDRKDVVFISICTDQSKKGWKNSITGGQYTHPESINLTTGGFRHEMIIKYNITSFPKLMLIDGSGNLVSRNLIHPANIDEVRSLIQKIEDTAIKNTTETR